MFKQNYTIIGVMSGTSLDGIDLAHIVFTVENKKWDFEILQTQTIPYSHNWLNKLKTAVDFSKQELLDLNHHYTELLGNTVKEFININQIKNIDAVCSHGHTILHQPQNGFTLQIGNLPQISSIIGQTIVCDFRVQDVNLGGQGAPLVPIGDKILFSKYNYCLNLGGFSNVSFEENNNRIAFDISPVNTVLNYYSNMLNLAYDDKGHISKSGSVNQTLLEELNAIEYYQKPYPKSLGFEFVKTTILPLIEKHNSTIQDKMRTFTEHIAVQTAMALPIKEGKLLATGGGTYNEFLLQRMQSYLPKMQIIIPEKKIIEYKEALIFALLGVLKLRNETNALSSVTGAKHDHSSGVIYDFK